MSRSMLAVILVSTCLCSVQCGSESPAAVQESQCGDSQCMGDEDIDIEPGLTVSMLQAKHEIIKPRADVITQPPDAPALSTQQQSALLAVAEAFQPQSVTPEKAAKAAHMAAEAAIAAASVAAKVVSSPQFGSQPKPHNHQDHHPASDKATPSVWHKHEHSIKQIVSGFSLAVLLKVLCIASNMVLSVSPLSQVKRWNMDGTGETDSAPFVCIAFAGAQWCFYGLFAWWMTSDRGFLVLVWSNCFGAILGIYYVTNFYYNCADDSFLGSLQKYLGGVFALVLLQVCAIFVLPGDSAMFLAGIIASFGSFLNATSILVTAPAVVRSKDSSAINGTYIMWNFACCALWSACGVMIQDTLVVIPNLCSCCSCMVCLTLKIIYPVTLDSPLGGKEGLEQKAFKDTDLIKPKYEYVDSIFDESFIEACKKTLFTENLECTGGSGGTGDSC